MEKAEVFSLNSYWLPVSEGEMGEYGISEMIIRSSSFFEIGDVGNDIWLDSRRLPFNDYDSSEIGVTGGIVRYADENHPELAPVALEDPTSKYLSDPTLEWVLLEIAKEEDKEQKTNRYHLLNEFLIEIKDFENKVNDDELELVPHWAIDIIDNAIRQGSNYDPDLFTERSQPASLTYRPVGRCPLPSVKEIKIYHNVYDEYRVKSTKKDWIFYLKNGEKTFAPVGKSIGETVFLKPPSIESAIEHQKITDSNLFSLLTENGVMVSKHQGTYKVTYNNVFETYEEIEKAITNISNEIQRSSAILTTIIDHRNDYLKTLNRSVAKDFVYKTKRGDKYLIDILVEETGKKAFNLMSSQEVSSVLTEDEVNKMKNNISSRVNDNLYLLQVRNNFGYQPLAFTKDKNLLDIYRRSKAIDICWFMLPAFAREKYQVPSHANTEAEANKRISLIENSQHFKATNWRDFIPYFNAGHSTKTIPSKANIEINWLFNQTTLNSRQIQSAKEAVSLLANHYIKLRSTRTKSSIEHKIAFNKIQNELTVLIEKWGEQFPEELLKKMSSGKVDIYFKFNEFSLEKYSKKELLSLLDSSKITYNEFKIQKFIKPFIKFTHKCHDYIDSFNIVKNYKLSDENLELIRNLYLRQKT